MDLPHLPKGRPELPSIVEALDAFLAALETQGIKTSADQRARINIILLSLTANGKLPNEATTLCRFIAPIVAGTPAEQATVEATLRSYWGAASADTSRERFDKKNDYDDSIEQRPKNTVPAKWFAWLLFATVVLIAIICLLPAFLGISWSPSSQEYQAGVQGTLIAINSDWLKTYPVEELAAPDQSPWNRSLRWYYTEYDAKKWAAVSLPWLFFLGALVLLYRRLIAFLRRSALKKNLRSHNWKLSVPNLRFGDRHLIASLQPLRLLAQSYRKTFDAEATVLATAEAGGRLRARFKEAVISTNFVAMIDRQSARDHLTAFNHAVVHTLKNSGLSFDVFEFNENPSLCRNVRDGEFVGLHSLSERFRGAIFLMFCAPEQLIDPVRGIPIRSVAALTTTRHAIIIKPEQSFSETDSEKALRLIGIDSLPATPAGIVAMAQVLTGTANSARRNPRKASDVHAEEGFFWDRPKRWMQTIAPSRVDRMHLKRHLLKSFGIQTRRWLAVTSIYPELRWPLTLALKDATGKDAFSTIDSELLAVSRLPWFRYGWMPDWVRFLLQDNLSLDERRLARRVVLRLLGLAGTESVVGQRLSIATNVEDRQSKISSDQILLDYLLAALPRTHPMFLLPRELAREFMKKPLRRLAAFAAGAALATVSLCVGALSLIPIDNCDLLGASIFDNQRIGPGNDIKVLRTFYGDRAIDACRDATQREPSNARFWYQFGRAISTNDPEEGHKLFLKSASLNYPAAFNGIGYDYSRGEGVPKDLEAAKKNFRTAVDLENWSSLQNLAAVAEEQNDDALFYKYSVQSVDHGTAATVDLARVYLGTHRFSSSLNVKDVARGLELLELGVRLHDGGSARYLGYLYDTGQMGLARDEKRAVQLYEKSVWWQVDAAGASNLALMYMNGSGVEKNLERATYWAIFASKLKYSIGVKTLATLIKSGGAKFKPGYEPPASLTADFLNSLLGDDK